MKPAEIEAVLQRRGCTIVEDGGKFALVYPHGYEGRPRTKDLLATKRESAALESWLWLHPDLVDDRGIDTVKKIVAADYRLSVEQLVAKDRSEPLATARRIAMALSRELTGATLEVIGTAFGGRDHGTVIHARDSLVAQCDTDAALAARLGTLRVACAAALLT
jgi:hypothetical protein